MVAYIYNMIRNLRLAPLQGIIEVGSHTVKSMGLGFRHARSYELSVE